MAEPSRVVLWQSLAMPGTDGCEWSQPEDRWHLSGTALTVAGENPALIDYEVIVDSE